MGYIEIRKLDGNDRIEVCDSCSQEGVYANGEEVKDHTGQVLIWLCFNCAYKQREALKKAH